MYTINHDLIQIKRLYSAMVGAKTARQRGAIVFMCVLAILLLASYCYESFRANARANDLTSTILSEVKIETDT